MRPARILDPDGSGTVALAVPLRHGAQRYIVLAPLSAQQLPPEYEAFFDVLESIRIPAAEIVPPFPYEVPVTPVEPLVLGFALCTELQDRVERTLLHRGWQLVPVDTFQRLYSVLSTTDPDVLIVDSDELPDTISALRVIHRAAVQSAPRLLAFETRPASGAQAAVLMDRRLPHDADDAEVFAALKDLVRGLPLRRQVSLERSAAAAHESVLAVQSPQELAEFGAEHAAALIRGWAGIALVSEYGIIYQAERPRARGAILSSIPKSFFADAPLFRVRIDDRFLEEVCDDDGDRRSLLDLGPVSGATLPIAWGERRLGALVALSQTHPADSSAFDALDRFAGVVARRFHELTRRGGAIPEYAHDGLWERWRNGALEVAVYRSPDCVTPCGYSAVSESRGVLTLGIAADDAGARRFLRDAAALAADELPEALLDCITGPDRLAAVVDAASESMSYAARDFPPPLLMGVRGPSGAIGSSHQVTTGVSALSYLDETVVCDPRMWRWFGDERATIRNFTALVGERAPQGLASVVKLSLPQNRAG
jgi:hypothetical protein